MFANFSIFLSEKEETMKTFSKFKVTIIQMSIIIIIAFTGWAALHHTPYISSDVYPYLCSLKLDDVKKSTLEIKHFPTLVWEDILAIYSTIPEKESSLLVEQLKAGVSFSNLKWGSILSDNVKLVQRHREILIKYKFYYSKKYYFPVNGVTWYVGTFGADREGGVRKHEGTDLFGKEGTPIINICSGIVEQIGWNRLGGERVGVRGEDGNYYYYAHLQTISSKLDKGKRIEAGEAIGTMGHTGDALTTPDHLHLGIQLKNGQWIDPYAFLTAWQLRGEERPDF